MTDYLLRAQSALNTLYLQTIISFPGPRRFQGPRERS